MRTAAGLSQRSLAERLEVSPAMVSMVESGDRQPSLELAQRWADMCGGTLAEGRRAALIELLHTISDEHVEVLWRTQQALAAGTHDWALAQVLLEEGASTVELAERLQCTPADVEAWRAGAGEPLSDADARALWRTRSIRACHVAF